MKMNINMDQQYKHTLPLNDLQDVIKLSMGMLHNIAILIVQIVS
jgi:hypothetical protein